MNNLKTIMAAVLLASSGSAVADTISVEWNETMLQAIRDTKPGPPMTARAIAIVHTCIYDAWAAYDNAALGTMYGDDLRQPEGARTEANKREAISHAAFMALSDLYPSRRAQFQQKLTSLGYSENDTGAADVAKKACSAVLSYRHTDGSNQLNGYADTTGYQPVNTPTYVADVNHWQPLPGQKFVTPHWKNVTPFALTSATQFLPKPPAEFGSTRFIHQAQEIINITANLTEEQKAIAEYWADGPKSELPPGHWTLFAEVVSKRDNHTTDQDAKMFFALGNALLDASIGCWATKVTYDSVRPITAIRYLYAGQTIEGVNGVLVDGANWKPYQPDSFLTPPFAEYTSGHSTFSAAAAVVLREFTESDKFEYSVDKNSVTLSWRTFTEAADEAGMSRRYGGIHFEDGDLVARHMGKKIGEQVWRKSEALFGAHVSR